MFKALFRDSQSQVDDWLIEEIGQGNVKKYTVSQKVYPSYRFVDLYHAIEAEIAGKPGYRALDSDNWEDLSNLIHTRHENRSVRQINRSTRSAWTVAPDKEEYLSVDRYWLFEEPDLVYKQTVIVRLKYIKHDESSLLEVASSDAEYASRMLKEFADRSILGSIYRQKMFALSFESGTKDEYGDIEKAERLRINFKTAQAVSRDEFVVDKGIFQTLKRNVIDLHQHRDRFKKLGVPIRRGVLLYGPPGTGKTYACRYICGCLKNTTRIIVAGTALHKVAQIFDLARIYQPSIVILEDVDLAFSSRDINLYSSSLGDLLDQMDGLRPFEDIGVILTTNSIERMEAAIKDRPGRISQCIHFGAPAESLRAQYIARYASAYDYRNADMNELLEMTSGTTPAFIKEWVHRSVQFASERQPEEDSSLHLETEDFRAAFEEMRQDTDEKSGRIIGFIN